MTTQRRRRTTRPVRKTVSARPPKKRRKKRTLKEGVIQFFIVLFALAIAALIFSAVLSMRRCSAPVIETPVEEVAEEPRVLQVEVLNGCGVNGVADKYTEFLRARGLDIVRSDNYESFNVLKTVVIDRRGDIQNAIQIAQTLGLSEERVLQEVNEAYLIDASIIIGKDFRQLSSWKDVEN